MFVCLIRSVYVYVYIYIYMSIRIASLQTEDLQENELFSASCQLVCEWAGKLLSRGFSSLRELSEFLVGNLYVNSKSTAAFTVLAAMQEAGLHNSRGQGQ